MKNIGTDYALVYEDLCEVVESPSMVVHSYGLRSRAEDRRLPPRNMRPSSISWPSASILMIVQKRLEYLSDDGP